MVCELPASSMTELLCATRSWGGWKAGFDFLNSGFVAGLAGAYFGASAAARIADRKKIRDELTREIRNTNAAMVVALGLCNSAIGLKKQLVKPMYTAYLAQQAYALDQIEKRRTGKIPSNVPIDLGECNFNLIVAPAFPVEALHRIIFEQLGIVGRACMLVSEIVEYVSALREACDYRTRLIHGFKDLAPPDKSHVGKLYLGLKYKGDEHNEEYPSAMRAIKEYLDHVIFFSGLLCRDLLSHGDVKLNEWRKEKLGGNEPKLHRISFGEVEAGLMPADSEYDEWLKGFRKGESPA